MIELKNISKTFHNGQISVRALDNVSLTITAGEFVAVMGPSGSGKSTLMHILGFLDKPESGSYKIRGKEITALSDDELAVLRGRLVGFVFQQFHLLRRTTALENSGLPLIYAGEKNIFEKAREKLKAVGLEKRMAHRPNELSGGEQQRVAIARALINDPLIILADEPTGNLDSKSEKEIISILKALNEQGKTIVIVTHEQEIARHCERIVVMRDGRILSDENKEKKAEKTVNNAGIYVSNIVSQKRSSWKKVQFLAYVRQSFHAILSNRVRSFLSMLGILFGVAAVIAMLALGEGAKSSIESHLKSLGSNLLSIRSGSAMLRGVTQAAGSVARFTFSDVDAIRAIGPPIKKVSGIVNGSGQLVHKNENWNTSINGVGYDFGEMRASIPEIGRWFTEEEIQRRDKVAVLGTTVVDKLFGDRDPIGEVIKINRINFRIIGIAPAKGSAGPQDQDDVVYIPITTTMYRILGKDYIDGLFVEVSDPKSMDEAQDMISKVIIKRHGLNGNEKNAFQIMNMSEIQEILSSTTKTMSLLLGCIAAISLLVGGIGIMNIMPVSVTERTQEIGLRKAVGARDGDIMSQFLVESVIMTFSGGIMGVILGTSTAAILPAFTGWTTKVTLFSVVLATTFSIAVGISFGIWPARKAAQLNPIEALRYE